MQPFALIRNLYFAQLAAASPVYGAQIRVHGFFVTFVKSYAAAIPQNPETMGGHGPKERAKVRKARYDHTARVSSLSDLRT